MSTPEAPTFADAINALLSAAAAVIKGIADTISANASLIGSVVVLGSVAVAAMTVARRVLPGITGFFRGLL